MDTDRIERDILINAPIERVWSLVTQPGFWVDHTSGGEFDLREGATFVSEHEEYGTFPMRIEKLDAPRYVSYRWASTFPGQEPADGNSTLIEFTLASEGEQTRLSVVESGFDSIDAPEEKRRQSHSDNAGGWAEELDGVRQRAEAPAA